MLVAVVKNYITYSFKVVQTFLRINILKPSDVGIVAIVVDDK